jgi:hypothetical protein
MRAVLVGMGLLDHLNGPCGLIPGIFRLRGTILRTCMGLLCGDSFGWVWSCRGGLRGIRGALLGRLLTREVAVVCGQYWCLQTEVSQHHWFDGPGLQWNEDNMHPQCDSL